MSRNDGNGRPEELSMFRQFVVDQINELRQALGKEIVQWDGYPPIPEEPPDEPLHWFDRPDLLDPDKRAVFLLHADKDTDLAAVETGLQHRVPGFRFYFKDFDDPRIETIPAENFAAGVLSFPEIEWTTMFGRAGVPMRQEDMSLCERIRDGWYDEQIAGVLQKLENAGHPMPVSMWHEVDLQNEQRRWPKGSGTEIGTDEEIAAAWCHIVDLGRTLGDNVRYSMILSSSVGHWPELIGGVRDHIDFIGYDPFNWFGVPYGPEPLTWTPFMNAFGKFGRPDLIAELAPGVPIIIGETATCQSLYKGKWAPETAGDWIAHLAEGVTIWNQQQGEGGNPIAFLTYFSDTYETHDRSISQPEHLTGLPTLGSHPGWVWLD